MQGFLKVVHGLGIIQMFDNAIEMAGCTTIAPYEDLTLGIPLDIQRIRSGNTKYILRRMLPANGFNLKDDKIELTYMNLMHPMGVENISPLQMEILLNGEEADCYNMTLTCSAEGDTLPPGGDIKLLFPNTFGLKSGDSVKISFEWFGRNIKLEQERTLN